MEKADTWSAQSRGPHLGMLLNPFCCWHPDVAGGWVRIRPRAIWIQCQRVDTAKNSALRQKKICFVVRKRRLGPEICVAELRSTQWFNPTRNIWGAVLFLKKFGEVSQMCPYRTDGGNAWRRSDLPPTNFRCLFFSARYGRGRGWAP